MIQRCVIEDWRPLTNPNGGTPHRFVVKRRHDIDAGTAWATAKYAGWKFIPGKVRLTITLVYSKRPLPDSDNAVARCKGIVDGLKNHPSPWISDRIGSYQPGPIGFFTDDSPEWLELAVNAVVEKGKKETRIELETLEPSIISGGGDA